MKALCVHAHFDDFEFVAAGLFQLWRKQLGPEFRGRILVCTDGQAGHHFRTREETGAIRRREQEESARLGGLEFQQLLLPNGQPPREACLQISTDLLAALWKAIRDFEPDYLFCPPLAPNPRAGIHNDHQTVADAVRRVAYMINVPHAFTPEYPADETQSTPCRVPVILNVYDGYMAGSNAFDLAVDVEAVFPTICEMTWCHQSQIMEWLPWVGRHEMQAPADLQEWSKMLRERYRKQNRELEIQSDHPHEVFTLTSWGEVKELEELRKAFPGGATRGI